MAELRTSQTGSSLRKARRADSLPLAWLASASGIPRGRLSEIERGDTPQWEEWFAIERAYRAAVHIPRIEIVQLGQRRAVIHSCMSKHVYVLYEPLSVGTYGAIDALDGESYGRATTRAGEGDHAARSARVLKGSFPELQLPDGVFVRSGNVTMIGNIPASRSLAIAKRKARARPGSRTPRAR